MTLQQVSLVSQIIAAAGSIGALIFVGLQLRDSARAVSANTAQAVAECFSNLYRWQSDNPSALENLIEIGLDMTRFATDAHLRSWAGFCPRNDESAGKRRSTRVRKGAPWLKTTLITAAWAAVRVKDSYLQAQFHRLRARRGAKKAILAVASSMLTAAYHMLKNAVEYKDLGAGHFARRDRGKLIQRLVRRINDLGCQVQLTPMAA